MRIDGEDIFPYATMSWDTDIEVGPGTPYPVRLTLEKLTKWWYRVKVWHVSVDLSSWSVTSTGGMGATASSAGENFTLETTKELSENEGDLLLSSYTANADGFVDPSEMEVDPGNRASSYVDLLIVFQFCNFGPSIVVRVESGQTYYYPIMRLTVQAVQRGEAYADIPTPPSFGFATMEQAYNMRSDSTFPGDLEHDVTIDGETITLYYQPTPAEYNYNEFGDGATIEASDQPIPDITITPFEYWSYSGVWNTTTGAKI